MKRVLMAIAVGLSCLCGCSRQESVVIDAVRGGKVVINHERIALSELGTSLKRHGFGSNTMVFQMGCPESTDSFTNEAIFLNPDKRSTHAHLRRVIDIVEQAGIGTWPESRDMPPQPNPAAPTDP